MQIEKITQDGVCVAVVNSAEQLISDSQSALDLIMSVKYNAGTNRIAVAKQNICEDFFILSSGLAGEILQKFVNYQVKFAVYGDFSKYTSKPLHDFIYESNQGQNVFFTTTQAEAVQRLAQAQ